MRKLVASCSTVVIAVAMLAACGGGGSSKSNPLAPGGNGGTSSDDFSKLVAEAAKQRFKITYKSDNGDPQTFEQDGKGNSVFGDKNSQTFTTKDSTISCDTSSDPPTCTQLPSTGGAATNGFTGLFSVMQTYINALGGKYGSKDNKTIAGRSAQCVTFSAKDIAGKLGSAIAGAQGASLKGSATYCVDKKTGATLEISGTDDSGKATTSLLVTKFEDPKDSDFTPPATPSTIPQITLPGGGTIPNITLPTIPGQ